MQNKVTLAVLSAAVVGVGGIVANAIRNIADAVITKIEAEVHRQKSGVMTITN